MSLSPYAGGGGGAGMGWGDVEGVGEGSRRKARSEKRDNLVEDGGGRVERD